ncbi:hypothetical protein HYPSUDRAFT_1023812 [Hypholoma sublateritium FD-334 SS-4]|uniref:FAD-binding domain-containing protein n=1 Tax=Hypholoma sublateritium (strain FD-334 SS-4) TaxID=945553 RepID=A0A0D2NE59_HYPSF|nr:hypothetical protein HYPSUDRAFT_1023812 [Hypholoma sublateritium FD-334 SS-4]
MPHDSTVMEEQEVGSHWQECTSGVHKSHCHSSVPSTTAPIHHPYHLIYQCQWIQHQNCAWLSCGIGGLSLAVALSHLHVDDTAQIDVYESAAKLTEIGAGISLWPRGWEILKALNMEDDLAALLNPGQEIPSKEKSVLALVFKKSDEPEDVYISDLSFPGGSVSFHRADILRVLLEHVSPRVQIHLGHRLASYVESDEGVGLTFKNGATAQCDMLVGADGIHSVVRQGFLAKEYNLTTDEAAKVGRPLWTGSIAYRSTIDSDCVAQLNPEHPSLFRSVAFCGKNQHVVAYPISTGKQINAVAFVTNPEKEGTLLEGPSSIPQTTDNVSAFFSNWSAETKCITDNMINPSRWAMEYVHPLESYGSGRIALLGDSAHAMAPHLGNGAGQAFEDAYILAHVLSVLCASPPHSSSASNWATDIAKVIQAYSNVRQPFGNFVARASTEQGKNYEFASAELADVRAGDVVAPERLAALEARIAGLVKWTWNSSVADDLERALGMI